MGEEVADNMLASDLTQDLEDRGGLSRTGMRPDELEQRPGGPVVIQGAG